MAACSLAGLGFGATSLAAWHEDNGVSAGRSLGLGTSIQLCPSSMRSGLVRCRQQLWAVSSQWYQCSARCGATEAATEMGKA